MKFVFLIKLFLVAFCCVSFQSQNPPFSIVGKWQTIDEKGNLMSFEFKKDGHYEMTTSEGTQKTDKKAELTYVFDQSKSPFWIDLILRNKKDSRMTLTLKGILEVIDKDNIKINIGGIDRPTDFFGNKVAAFQRAEKK